MHALSKKGENSRHVDGRLFFSGAGGRLPIRNGVGEFTIKLIHSNLADASQGL